MQPRSCLLIALLAVSWSFSSSGRVQAESVGYGELEVRVVIIRPVTGPESRNISPVQSKASAPAVEPDPGLHTSLAGGVTGSLSAPHTLQLEMQQIKDAPM